MSDPDAIARRMRDAWNDKAREDARFYIAFGRRNQDDAEFAESGADVLRRIAEEFPRLAAPPETRRFLEIGCGIGRLMDPLSAQCAAIHGVDIADDMIALGQARLAANPRAHLHWAEHSDLSNFADASFDLVYSFAVMQHLPDEAPFWRYLIEAARVLAPGGVLLEQFNSHHAGRATPDCWAGIVVAAPRVLARCASLGLRVVGLEGAGTQYTWLTAIRQPAPAPRNLPGRAAHIARVRGTEKSPSVTAGGPHGIAELLVTGLDDAWCDLAHLGARMARIDLAVRRILPRDAAGNVLVHVAVPEFAAEGEADIVLTWDGVAATAPARLRVQRFLRAPPCVLAVTDGIDLLSQRRIVCGTAKLWINNLAEPATLRAHLGGQPVRGIDVHCEDALDQRYQVNLHLPESVPAGWRHLQVMVGETEIFSEAIEILAPTEPRNSV